MWPSGTAQTAAFYVDPPLDPVRVHLNGRSKPDLRVCCRLPGDPRPPEALGYPQKKHWTLLAGILDRIGVHGNICSRIPTEVLRSSTTPHLSRHPAIRHRRTQGQTVCLAGVVMVAYAAPSPTA